MTGRLGALHSSTGSRRVQWQGPLRAQRHGVVGIEIVETFAQLRPDEGLLDSDGRTAGYGHPEPLQAACGDGRQRLAGIQGWEPLDRTEQYLARVARVGGCETSQRAGLQHQITVE
jgi:hypothetical protein